MKTAILTCVMAFMAITAFGQDKIDVVYLKDGRVIKGSIIKPLDVDGVKIMTMESDVYTFTANEVKRIGRETFEHNNRKNKINVHDGEGFTNITTLGFGFGVGSVGDGRTSRDNDETYFAIHTVNGYHLLPAVSLGAGVGVEWYGDYELVPLYADVRFHPSLTEWAPFFYGQVGYGLGFLEENQDGGLMGGLGGGVQYSLNPNFALVGSLGYRYQGNTVGTENLNAHFLQISAGVKF